MTNVVRFPYNACRRVHSRKPRISKNGTAEERAARAAAVRADPSMALNVIQISRKPAEPHAPLTAEETARFMAPFNQLEPADQIVICDRLRAWWKTVARNKHHLTTIPGASVHTFGARTRFTLARWRAGADRSYRTAVPDFEWLTAAPSGRAFVRTLKYQRRSRRAYSEHRSHSLARRTPLRVSDDKPASWNARPALTRSQRPALLVMLSSDVGPSTNN
jgi:hypothetical protein